MSTVEARLDKLEQELAILRTAIDPGDAWLYQIGLRGKAIAIARLLLQHDAVTPAMILHECWHAAGRPAPSINAIETIITRMRVKLTPHAVEIQRGSVVGWSISADDKARLWDLKARHSAL